MAESLLSLSRIYLFGQKVEDLAIVGSEPINEVHAASTAAIAEGDRNGDGPVDDVVLAVGHLVLIKDQGNGPDNQKLQGVYEVQDDGAGAPGLWERINIQSGTAVRVGRGGTTNKNTTWILQRIPKGGTLDGDTRYFAKVFRRKGVIGTNKQLADQLGDDANFAKIYGFSYEGVYYDLARPTLFLVHGDGEPVSDTDRRARSPFSSSETGVSAADFQFGDEVLAWHYDRADYSIRMDVETGMFEDILLEAELDEESAEAFYSGSRARVSGSRARVSGSRARVSGSRARVSGSRARGRDHSD